MPRRHSMFSRLASFRAASIGSVIALVSACSSDNGSGSKPDLPAGWEGAQAVTDFAQAACGGSADAPGAPSESIDASTSAGSVSVAYHAANFRCEQSVQGFVRTGPKSLDFLVQPVDMNPAHPAGCDCLYEISLAANASSGATTITLYRRWDNSGGSSNPVEVGTTLVTVP
jgi:hypothetical protein